MKRWLFIAALAALGACSKQESAPAPTQAPAPASPESAAPAAGTPAPAPAAAQAAPSETAQATGSQESGDSGEHPTRSDTSLEKIAPVPTGAQLPAGKWKAGVNYTPLVPAQPTNVAAGKVEVLEVFWLACPHCYALEPKLQAWLKHKPAYVEFVRVPVVWQPGHRAHARLYYTLDVLGRQDLVEKAFDTIHQDIENRVPPLVGDTDDETFRLQQQFAVKNGISADDFAKTYNSFTVSTDIQRAEELTQRYRVQGVPFFAVNGKYTTGIGEAGGEEKLLELLGDLAAAEHGGH